MRILVCFKVVPELDQLRAPDWVQPGSGEPPLQYCKRSLNSYDESALEWSLRIADAAKKNGDEVDISAVTVGGDHNDAACKTLSALPFARVAQISFPFQRHFNPRGIAHVLAAYAKKEGPFDLILMGQQAGVGDHGMTPAHLAARLGFPCLQQVRQLSPAAQGLDILRNADGGTLRQVIRLPAVLSIGDSDVNYLRVPTLRQRMQARPPESIAFETLGISPNNISSTQQSAHSFHRQQTDRQCQWISADNAQGCAEALHVLLCEKGAL